VIRIVRENRLRLALVPVLDAAMVPLAADIGTAGGAPYAHAKRPFGQGGQRVEAVAIEVLDFLTDRLRVQLRAEGTRHDVVTAVLGAAPDDDLNRLLRRADAVRAFVESEAGANLLAAHRRAANILRIEEKRDGHAYDAGYERHLLKAHEEEALAEALEAAAKRIALDLDAEDFERAMEAMATLRAPVDAFFDRVIVNDPAPELRRNRLRLLARLRATMDAVADFSKIEA
jgi:glycyl-tRNA synthetase beta chain